MTLDVSVRLPSAEAVMSLEDLWHLLYSQLGAIEISEQVARRFLPQADYATGELACWIMHSRNDFSLLIDMEGTRSIEGAGYSNQADVTATLPLELPEPGGTPASRARKGRAQLAGYLLAEVFRTSNRLDYDDKVATAIQAAESST
jgi:hypothetical protein